MKRGTTLIEAVAHCEEIYAKLITEGYSYPSKSAKKQDAEYLSGTYTMVCDDREFRKFAYNHYSTEQQRLIAEAGLDCSTLEKSLELMPELNKISKKIDKTHGYPMYLRHVRMSHLQGVFSLFSKDVADMVERLSVILGAVQSTEVVERKEMTVSPEQRVVDAIGFDRSRLADRNLAREAFAAYKDLKTEELKKFATQYFVSANLVNVTNEFGTNFDRHMFFLNGRREALQVAMSFVDKDFDYWLVNGKPQLAGKTYEELKEFYKGAA